MEMTIERAINIQRENFEISTSLSGDCEYFKNKVINNDVGYNSEEYLEATKISIDTMRKYQKIEQIVRNYDTAWEFHTLRDTVDKIREVLKDENVN